MSKTTEKIPTWSLGYIINGDATALTDDEVLTIDRWMKQWQVQTVSPLTDEEGNAQPYFTHYRCSPGSSPIREKTYTPAGYSTPRVYR